MRVIAFDAGTKRIGVAVSDESQTISSPVGFIENNEKLDSELERLKNQYAPGITVVGNPINMDGSRGPKSQEAAAFAEKLKAVGFSEVVLWDERLTTVQAQRVLISGDVSRKDRKGKVDSVAAALILQNYIDYLKNKAKK